MSLSTNLQNFATRAATEAKSLRTLINANMADLSALNTTAKSNLVAAINELKSAVDAATAAAGAQINDAATASTTQTWSVTGIQNHINAAISALTNNAPTALDTLKELADAIGDDANFAATITNSLNNRLRFDAAQTLSAGQQQQGIANLGAIAAADVGDTTVDLVATFNAGLA